MEEINLWSRWKIHGKKLTKKLLLRRVGEEKAIISVIHRRQRVWLGHSIRRVDLVLYSY